MDKKSKRKVAGGAVYVFCAFMLISILTIAMLTAIGDRKRNTGVPTPSTAPVTDRVTSRVTGKADREEDWERVPGDTASDSDGIINGTEPAEQTSAVPYSYCMPVNGYIAKSFNNELAVWSETMRDYRAHCGIDLEAPEGTEVLAFADGKIAAVYKDQFMGDCVCIEHSGGMRSYYMNLSGVYPDNVTVGADVACGQVVGSVGKTASLEAYDPSHLHFEVTVDGARVDPLNYVEYDPASVGFEG